MAEEDLKIEVFADAMRDRIKKGDFGTSGRLPSVTQLAKDYHLTRTTVNQALSLLRSEGMLYVRDTSYFVNYPILKISGMPFFDAYLERQGLTPVVDHLVEASIIAMPADVAEAFGQSGDALFVNRRLRHGTTEVPLRLIESWYPAELAGEFLEAVKKDPSINVATEIRKAHGLALGKVHEDVACRHPTSEEVDLLSIVRTTPVIDIKRHCFSDDDRPIIFSHVVLVAAYFLLSYDYRVSAKKEG